MRVFRLTQLGHDLRCHIGPLIAASGGGRIAIGHPRAEFGRYPENNIRDVLNALEMSTNNSTSSGPVCVCPVPHLRANFGRFRADVGRSWSGSDQNWSELKPRDSGDTHSLEFGRTWLHIDVRPVSAPVRRISTANDRNLSRAVPPTRPAQPVSVMSASSIGECRHHSSKRCILPARPPPDEDEVGEEGGDRVLKKMDDQCTPTHHHARTDASNLEAFSVLALRAATNGGACKRKRVHSFSEPDCPCTIPSISLGPKIKQITVRRLGLGSFVVKKRVGELRC